MAYYSLNLTLASTYGSGNYDSATYNGSTTGSSTSASSGSLVDTGMPVGLYTGLAVVIVALALATVLKKRLKILKPKPTKPSPGSYGSGSF